MEATNTLEFYTGCHEMRDTVFAEYKQTVHYSNRTGVRTICSDGHVPKDWTHKMVGSINTPEKFEAKRMTLATHEWERMKESHSRECRNCHKGIAHQLPKEYRDPDE